MALRSLGGDSSHLKLPVTTAGLCLLRMPQLQVFTQGMIRFFRLCPHLTMHTSRWVSYFPLAKQSWRMNSE